MKGTAVVLSQFQLLSYYFSPLRLTVLGQSVKAFCVDMFHLCLFHFRFFSVACPG